MNEDDVKCLSNFLEKPGMYIVSMDKTNITSFIQGYELGTQGRCKFTETLSDLLASKYNIKKYATGWSNQIGRYCESNEELWVETFIQLGFEVLSLDSYA